MAAAGNQAGAVRVRGRASVRVHPSSSSTNAGSSNSSPSSARPMFGVFCKGQQMVIADEMVGLADGDPGTPVLAVTVCGPQGEVVLRGHKPALGFVAGHDGGGDVGQVLLEAMALVEGLHTAIRMGITSVKAITDHRLLYNYMVGLSRPAGEKLADLIRLISQALSAQKQFEQCEISLAEQGQVGNAVKLAKEGLDVEIARYLSTKENTESCRICLEDVDTTKMHAVEGCAHRFCLVCMKTHVKIMLLGGMAPRCPQPGCTTKLTEEGSTAWLSPRLLGVLAQRLREEQIRIHPSLRIYCPYPRCSALMSLSEVAGSFSSPEYPATFSVCVECGGPMCVECKVPWHERMSCLEYQRRHPHGGPEGEALHKLARQQLWQRCEMCHHMIELAMGCAHIICVCGNHLCYRCGKTIAEGGRCGCSGLAADRRRWCFRLPACWGGTRR